jgi:hypothetical protein
VKNAPPPVPVTQPSSADAKDSILADGSARQRAFWLTVKVSAELANQVGWLRDAGIRCCRHWLRLVDSSKWLSSYMFRIIASHKLFNVFHCSQPARRDGTIKRRFGLDCCHFAPFLMLIQDRFKARLYDSLVYPFKVCCSSALAFHPSEGDAR